MVRRVGADPVDVLVWVVEHVHNLAEMGDKAWSGERDSILEPVPGARVEAVGVDGFRTVRAVLDSVVTAAGMNGIVARDGGTPFVLVALVGKPFWASVEGTTNDRIIGIQFHDGFDGLVVEPSAQAGQVGRHIAVVVERAARAKECRGAFVSVGAHDDGDVRNLPLLN